MFRRKVGDSKTSAVLRRKDMALLMEAGGQGLFCNSAQNRHIRDQ